jgi:uroporphyrinogen-III synthase
MSRLSGRRLLLTRDADDAADWIAALSAEGATPIVLPCIATEPLITPALAGVFAAALAAADWLVVTSRRGADAVATLLAEAGNARLPDRVRLAAVGPATAGRLCEHFGRVDLIGTSTAAALAADLADEPSLQAGTRCILALAANAGDTLAATLQSVGASVQRFDVYRTVPAPPQSPKRPWSSLDCAAVIFASPTAVTGFANQVDVDTACQMVTIGPSTSTAVREHDWTVAAEAREPNLSAIIDSMLESTHA